MINEQSFNTILPVMQGGKKRQLRVGLFTLRSSSGLVAQVTNYGAKIVSLVTPNKEGVKADVVLGFNTLGEWMNKETYFNAVIGRVANRIKDGKRVPEGFSYTSDNNQEWMTIAGSITFLAGLGISGAVWMKNKNTAEEKNKKTAADQ